MVIVHHRGRDRLFRTLAPAALQAGREGAEVVLIDNASREGVPAETARRFPGVRVLTQSRNMGFAEACRVGAESAAAPHVVFLNDDAVPEDGWLSSLLAAAARKPGDVAVIAGRLTDPSGLRNDFSDGFVTFDGHAFSDLVGAPVSAGGAGEERFFACGGNMLADRSEFLDAGGFDGDYFAYLEDVDFGWRQWIFGKRILFEPAASARHEGGATGQALGVFKRGFLIERNAFATAYKNFESDHLRDALPALLAVFLARVAAMVSRDPGASDLSRDPYAEPAGRRKWASLLSRVFGIRARESVLLGDPLAIAQLRALRWIFAHRDALQEKREWVQARRRRGDREIFSKFPAALVPTYPGDDVLASKFFQEIQPRILALRARNLSDIFVGPR
ncbi:MAG: glycosyltransferase family 2 protein [Thermoanaerobaculia bacterium]